MGKRGSTTFLFSALPGDLKTPPNGSFGLFGAFGQSGRARLTGVLRLLVAETRGGLGSRGLLRPGAAAGLRDADAAAILWGGLKLRKRLLHLVVSAAAATFPARVRRRRGLRLRSSRHRAGVRSAGKLLPIRSTGVGGRGGGPASPPSCSQPTHPLPPRGRWPLSRPSSLSGAPKRAPQPCGPAPRTAPRSSSSSAGPHHSTCWRRGREGAGPSRRAPPMGARRPPSRVRTDSAGGRSLGAPEPAKRGDRNARRVPRRRGRLRGGWASGRAASSRSTLGQCCRRGRRAAPGPGNAGVACFRARLPGFSAHDSHRPGQDRGSGCGTISAL